MYALLLNNRNEVFKIERNVPEYYKYFNWYDLRNAMGIYNFIQEMIDSGIDINDYPDIKVYYDILYSSAFKEEPNMITVDYVVKKMRNALIRYNLAHTTSLIKGELYYFWYGG